MKPFLKGERGSFTFEATLVFPAFLIFVLAGVFFCIVIFQMGTAHYTAQKVASQVAYTWNNSHKDLETGEFEKHLYPGLDSEGDGLYWRIFDNGVLGMFGLEGVFSPAEDGALMTKLRRAELNYSNALTVDVDYNNYIIYSEVTATAESELFMPTFLKNMIDGDSNTLQATSNHVVTETPELIRNYNFANYLWRATGLADATENILNSISDFFN